MSVLDFCKTHDIKTVPVHCVPKDKVTDYSRLPEVSDLIKKKWDKDEKLKKYVQSGQPIEDKERCGFHFYTPKGAFKVFNDDSDMQKKYKWWNSSGYVGVMNAIGIDTSRNYCIIDFDDTEGENLQLIKDYKKLTPWWRSRTKRLYHFIFQFDGHKKEEDRYQIEGVDILTGQWSVIWRNELIHNGDMEVAPLPEKFVTIIEEYKMTPKKTPKDSPKKVSKNKSKKEEKDSTPMTEAQGHKFNLLKKLLDVVEVEGMKYGEWLKIGMACYNELGEHGFDLFNKFSSRQEDKYKGTEDVQSYWDQFKEKDDGCKMGTIFHHAFLSVNAKLATARSDESKKNVTKYTKLLEDLNYWYDKYQFEWEKNIFKVLEQATFTQLSKDRISDFTKPQLTVNYENFGKSKDFLKRWYKDQTQRQYDAIVCKFEDKDITGEYNIFTGWKAQYHPGYEDTPQLKTVLDHIQYLSENSERNRDYSLTWMSHMLKHTTHKKQNLALLFHSLEEGSGKNMFVEWLGNNVIGRKHFHPGNNPATLLEKHCEDRVNKALIMYNEAEAKDTFTHSELLKTLITDTTDNVNGKYKKAVSVEFYGRWIFLTNNKCPVKIGQSDRRFACFNATMPWKNQQEKSKYLGNLDKVLNDPLTADYFYSYLMDMDTDKFYEFVTHRPETKYYKKVQTNTVPILLRFVYDYIKTKPCVPKKKEVYSKYKKYCEQNNYKNPLNYGVFSSDLRDIDGIVMKRINHGSNCVFEFDKVKVTKYLEKKTVLIEEENDIPLMDDDEYHEKINQQCLLDFDSDDELI